MFKKKSQKSTNGTPGYFDLVDCAYEPYSENRQSASSTCIPPVIYEIKLKTNRVYTCDHCFANGVAGPNGECEYCGSPLPISEK